jgi:F plasmid transfer operon, TraF, protein
MKHILQLSAATLTLVCASAYAQDGTFDPRALAMGGTGVTAADNSNAVFHNAAMLASSKHDDSFTLEAPVFSVRLLDPQSMQNDITTLNTDATAMQNALNAFTRSQTAANIPQMQIDAGNAVNALKKFNGSMAVISGKNVSAGLFGGTVFSLPSARYAFSLLIDGRAEVAAQFNYAPGDQALFTAMSADVNICAGLTPATPAQVATACANVNAGGGKVQGLTSNVEVRGFIAKDFGLAVARHFDDFYGLDIGLVPKYTVYSTFDVKQNPQSNTTLTTSQVKKDFGAFGMDAGVAKTFQRDADTQIKTGLAIKNLIPSSGTTALGNRIEAKPLATLGVSYETPKTSSGIDLDITPNKAAMTGFNKDAQYLRLGAEFDAWRWAQIRIGYRHDLKGNYPGLPSIGLGLSPFGIHADLSVAAASKKEMAVSLQTGFRF